MTDPMDARLLALLENRLDDDDRLELLERLENDPELLAQLEAASAGLMRVERMAAAAGPARPALIRRSGVPAWWLAAAAVLATVITAPIARATAPTPATVPGASPTPAATFAAVRPDARPGPAYRSACSE